MFVNDNYRYTCFRFNYCDYYIFTAHYPVFVNYLSCFSSFLMYSFSLQFFSYPLINISESTDDTNLKDEPRSFNSHQRHLVLYKHSGIEKFELGYD